MLEKPSSGSGKALLLCCGLLLGFALTLAGRQTVNYTSTDAFCDQACHSHPHATQMWIQSPHYSNKRGIVTHCTDCHLPPDGLQYLAEKARLGMHDAYAQIFRDVSKIDWSRERQLDRALTFSYDSACIHCHGNLFSQGLSNVAGTLPRAVQQASVEQVREMKIVARRMEAHLYYQRNEQNLRCINCHLFAGHRVPSKTMPRIPVYENAEFPARATGFQSYTEVVAGSDIKFHMIAVPGGVLETGSPAHGACRQRDAGPASTEQIRSFWMAQATVSRHELEWFFAQRKSQGSAAELTQLTATAYTEWLSRATGKKYRLPTEAELEYACMAGGTMPAWVQTDSRAIPDASADVAVLNPWGFMDLPDQSMEFTFDSLQNPQGAWWYSGQFGIGFRVVRVPEESPPAPSVHSGSTAQVPSPPGVAPLEKSWER